MTENLAMKKKILVLQNIACEDLGTLELAIRRREMEHKYLRLYDRDKVPLSLDGYSGLIILGGPMSVYETEEYPFLMDEVRLIKEAINKDIPALGICLGAQLIARAMGAKVFAGNKKEIGWYSLSLTEEGLLNPVFTGIDKNISVFQWHGDTFEIPANARRLAESEIFPNQAFITGEKVIALQFHLEVTEEAIYKWIKEYKEELNILKDYIDSDKIRKETKDKIENLKNVAEKFYANFLKLT